jgi:hypothetical protein
MPLSEHEQRLLDQIERALYAEDPKFASSVRGGRVRPSRRRRIQGIASFVLGVALLVGGLLVPLKVLGIPVVSFVGAMLMFLGMALFWFAVRRWGGGDAAGGEAKGQEEAKSQRSGFTQRMEERFRKRFDGTD